MIITAIRAGVDTVTLTLEGAREGERLTVLARVPIVRGDKPEPERRVVAEYGEKIVGGQLVLPRFAGAYDTLICRFEIPGAQGVRYVTDVDEDVAHDHHPYPSGIPLKAINCRGLRDDFRELGFAQTSSQVNQALAMTLHPKKDDIAHEFNGETYYFKRDVIEDVDREVTDLAQMGVPAIFRNVNASFLVGDRAEKDVVDIIQHPGYDYNFPDAYVGAYNITTEEGLNFFCAYTDFVLDRYTREDHKYGWCSCFEVGNEVTSQYIWNNQGEMTCRGAMEEYTEILRLTWLLSRRHWSNFRTFTSFDQYFCGRHKPDQPLRYYGMRECMDNMMDACERDGNFPWNVAFHPYPENLSYPDFWNDREPTWSFDTRRITFKNLEVMPAYLAQPRFLYHGEPRRIILPEQGFNSRDGLPYTEEQGMYGYVLAYQKMKKLGTIDMFLHHNYIDGPWEFGLNLGIRRCLGYDENNREIPGEKKPICDAIAAMDTPEEPKWVERARAFIGAELFDKVLNPPAVDAGKAKDTVSKNFDA